LNKKRIGRGKERREETEEDERRGAKVWRGDRGLLRITGEHSTRIKVSFVPFLFFLAVSY